MVIKLITFCVGIVVLIVLFALQNAFSKPIYNKMSNVWEEDSYGRMVSKLLIIIMIAIAFIIGAIIT